MQKKRGYKINTNENNNGNDEKKLKVEEFEKFPKIKIIALRLPEEPDEFISAEIEQKIEWIAHEINEKCNDLSNNYRDFIWIFAAQEFLISDIKEPVDENSKALFKKKMDHLVKKYEDNLYIIGTILSKKQRTNVSEIIKLHDKLLEYFPAINKNIELKEYKAIQNYDLNNKQIYSVRNSAIFFSKNTCKTVDKKAINLDDVDNGDKECLFIIQPAKTTKAAQNDFLLSNSNPIVFLKHKDFPEIPIGIEICKDHVMGLLKNHLEKTNTPSPVIHFILSASAKVNEHFFCGEYNMYIDSDNEPILKKSTLDSKFYVDFEMLTLDKRNCPDQENLNSK